MVTKGLSIIGVLVPQEAIVHEVLGKVYGKNPVMFLEGDICGNILSAEINSSSAGFPQKYACKNAYPSAEPWKRC